MNTFTRSHAHPAPRRAFTLIELLIVVAIISILAAIAVPNMLEAQVRSKVSASKSNLRTLTVAVESYYVDSNAYPPDAQTNVIPFHLRFARLTTPVAFISSVPADPFSDKGEITRFLVGETINPWSVDGSLTGLWAPVLTYDFANRRAADGTMEDIVVWSKISTQPESISWAMRGIGPSKDPTYLGHEVPPYDPTNGTVSRGHIFWTGPGRGLDEPNKI